MATTTDESQSGKGNVHLVAIDDFMVALKWADKRQVPMLLTVHDDAEHGWLREDVRK